ncbi:MAG: magnesium chelatase domain-containing protein [Actinomycetes bacterium]
MPLARACAVGLVGLQGHLVEVEAHLSSGLPAFTLVGLPDAALSESRDRVRAAILNSGEAFPPRRITVGLSPASLPKRGSGYDLALAVAVLAGSGALPASSLEDVVLLGELGLDGRVRGVRGVLPSVLAAAESGASIVVVPRANAAEALLVPGIEVMPVRTLGELLARLRGDAQALEDEPEPAPSTGAPPVEAGLDLADVLGQVQGRFALEVAAAGGHHLFLLGPPGVGNTTSRFGGPR